MKYYKYLILGAGPSALSFARRLKDQGEESFLMLEKESEPGGLCRTVAVDGAPLDLGGGHFLDVKSREVLEFIFRFLPKEEWQEYDRSSIIRLRSAEIDYPLEANIWQLPLADQVDFLESIAQAGCVSGLPMPTGFEDWITWKLGRMIAAEYMLPYNRKIWSIDLKQLGTYWLYKLPDVSFRETLQSCLEHKGCGTMPAHAKFLYPRRFGYGEVWKRIGASLDGHLLTNTPVTNIDLATLTVNGSFQAGKIINTIPWPVWTGAAELPQKIVQLIASLRHASIDVDYFPENLATGAHWIYEPDEKISYHRILCRSNFCPGSRGFWTETNSSRNIGQQGWRHCNEFAYPLNTMGKQEAMLELEQWAGENGVSCLGRWGKWEHMNSDIAVLEGLAAADKIMTQKG